MTTFRKMAEGHGDEVEIQERAKRMADALEALVEGESYPAGGAIFHVEPENKTETFGGQKVYFERSYPTGEIELESGKTAAGKLILGSRKDGVFIPDDPKPYDMKTELKNAERKGIDLSIELETDLGEGKATRTKKRLGKIIGLDQEGYPLIAIREKDPSGEFTLLDKETDEYQEALLFLYGTADTVEKERKEAEKAG